MIFPKYMEGQQISAYTNKDEIFEGYIKIKDGIHYVVNSDGNAKKLSELKKAKRIGRLLNEEAEKDWAEELQKFGDYYQNTFDTEKVEKANDDVKGKIIDEFSAASDDNNVKNHAEDFKKDAMSIINQKTSEDKIANGTSTVDNEIEKLKKDPVQESLFSNKKIQKAILKEAEIVASDGANYMAPSDDFGLDDTNRDYALDQCQTMIDANETRDAVVDTLQTEFEMSKDEAELMYDELSQDNLSWDSEPISNEEVDNQNDFDLYDVISNDVDNQFEDELNNCSDEIDCDSYSILEHLSSKFGGDPQKALEEAGNVYEGVLNLAEQVKMNRVNEERMKQRSK